MFKEKKNKDVIIYHSRLSALVGHAICHNREAAPFVSANEMTPLLPLKSSFSYICHLLVGLFK